MRRLLLALLSLMVCCAKPAAPSQEVQMVPNPTPNPIPTQAPAPTPSGVPPSLYATAVAYYEANLRSIPNQRYMTIVDFSKWSGTVRFWIINMQTNTVESALHVAHGSGSDPHNTGYATLFSNVPNSYKSSLGFYLTTDQTVIDGANGTALVIQGLNTTDSNAEARGILVHGASYVYDQNVQAGRSEGCFAVPIAHRDHVIGELRGGSLLYAGLSGTR